MSKVFNVSMMVCVKDYTRKHKTAAEASTHFASNILFVDAPDYVFEGWGYNPLAEGDDRFIKPEAPEGFIYDDATGTFYKDYTNKEKRKLAYSNGVVPGDSADYHIVYENEVKTVDEMILLGTQYAFKGQEDKAEEIKQAVVEMVSTIKTNYPEDEINEKEAEA